MPAHTNKPARAPRRDGWTRDRERLFLETLAAGHTVVWACVRVGLSRRSAYNARRRDPWFARAWRDAQQHARRAEEAAFLSGLPKGLRAAVFQGPAGCELNGHALFLQDSVIPVRPV